MGDLLTVVSDPEFLDRQADHSRSVPIVLTSFVLHYYQNNGYSQVSSQAIVNGRRQVIVHYTREPCTTVISCVTTRFLTWAALLISPMQYNTIMK